MKNQYRQIATFGAAFLITVSGAAMRARADVTLTQVTRISNPVTDIEWQHLNDDQKKALGAQAAADPSKALDRGLPLTETISIHGHKTRIDLASGLVVIVDGDTQQVSELFPHTQTYRTVSIADFQRSTLRKTEVNGTPLTWQVKDTGEMKMLSGHPIRRYRLIPYVGIAKEAYVQDVWAMTDKAPVPGYGECTALQMPFGMQRGLRQIPWLIVSVTWDTSTPDSPHTRVTVTTTTFSEKPLPPALFTVPAKYKRVPGGILWEPAPAAKSVRTVS